MAKGVPGSGHAQYHLSQIRKNTLPKEMSMGSKYVGNSPKPKMGGTMKGKGGKRGC